jgi:hypothetical protein
VGDGAGSAIIGHDGDCVGIRSGNVSRSKNRWAKASVEMDPDPNDQGLEERDGPSGNVALRLLIGAHD